MKVWEICHMLPVRANRINKKNYFVHHFLQLQGFATFSLHSIHGKCLFSPLGQTNKNAHSLRGQAAPGHPAARRLAHL